MRALLRSLPILLLALAAAAPGHEVHGQPPVATPASLAGQLLVATPALEDPNFSRTVVYLVQHDAEGAMGIVVNRVVASGPLQDLLESLGIEADGEPEARVRVHAGGPVRQEQALVLHSGEYQLPHTLTLRDGLAVSGAEDVLRDLAHGHGPQRSLLAVGYAGWGPGQLESELAAGAWVTVPADAGLIFDDDDETKWQRALAREGVEL